MGWDGREGKGGKDGREGKEEGRGGERGQDVEGPGKWSAPGPVLALGGPDHNPLTYITESSTKSAKLMRWLLSLQSYNVTFKYKEGRKNVVADCLSRLDSATE